MGACARLCRAAGSLDDEEHFASALLVTGRRGPFPSYRVNGIYRPVQADKCEVSTSVVDIPVAACYRRVDRPEVSIWISSGSSTCFGTWVCEVGGEVIARSCSRMCDNRLLIEVRESDGKFLVDHNIVILHFPRPAIAALKPSACFPKVRAEWQYRRIDELLVPTVVSDGRGVHIDNILLQRPINGTEKYTLWGSSGSSNSLFDLLQGDVGNCGVLAAIDSLVHEDPHKYLGHLINDRGSLNISVQLFDPVTQLPFEWKLGSSPYRKNKADVPAMLQVAVGSMVPRFARSLSNRAWGFITEAALADVAGSHLKLHECEPGVTWLTLLGSSCTVHMYWRSQDANWVQHLPSTKTTISDTSSAVPPVREQLFLHKSSWDRASKWKNSGVKLGDTDIIALLETWAIQGVALVLYPIGRLRPDKQLGEPCVPLEVYFGPDSQSLLDQSSPQLKCAQWAKTRFLLGHAYSVRAVFRASAQSRDCTDELWLRLRDPRRTLLFWVPLSSVIAASDGICCVYTCDRFSNSSMLR